MSLQPVPFSRRKAPEACVVAGRPDDIRHVWTSEEDAVLHAYYALNGAGACLEKLPSYRTLRTVYARANLLGLKTSQRRPTRRHEFSAELDTRIRGAWPLLKGRGSVQMLADELGLDRWVLSKRALKLGLTMPHKKEPLWTAAETELLKKVPLHDPEKCARIFAEHGFHRTPTSIMVRSKRVGLSRRFKDGLSAGSAAKILGIDNKTMCGWLMAGDIPATRRGSKRLTQQGGDIWVIKPKDFRRFIIDHVERIDIRKVDKLAFVALLASLSDDDAEYSRVS